MNRRDRRRAAKQGHNSKDLLQPGMWMATMSEYKRPKPEKPKPPVPGIDIPPECPEFKEQVARNKWHDKSEFMAFVEFINNNAYERKLSFSEMIKPIGSSETEEPIEPKWSWSRNHKCKYVTLHVDMRDGGFTVLNQDGERINMEQLMWQWKDGL